MKKKLLLTICFAIIWTISFNNLALADLKKGEGAVCNSEADCGSGLSCIPDPSKLDKSGGALKVCRDLVNVLTQRPTTTNTDAQQLTKLPDVSLEGGMTLAIKAILRSAMYLTIIAIVVAAIYYIISRGKDEDMTKAKDIILYLVIGMAIIAAAYGIVAGVTQFNVFS
ncbi:MAG: hypothetical protein NTZ25_05000 [Candidatus Peregrinibacteria bacterium]|nr:hypothetical protein [Candidatus Peregrinibacteria bacterium]